MLLILLLLLLLTLLILLISATPRHMRRVTCPASSALAMGGC